MSRPIAGAVCVAGVLVVAATASAQSAAQKPRAPEVVAPASLSVLDDDGDGKLNAWDRIWGSLRVWVDANGDGRQTPAEVRQASIVLNTLDVPLGAFETHDGVGGDIRTDRVVWLDLGADGFGKRTAGILSIDTDAARKAGFDIRSSMGEHLTGVKALASGWLIRTPGGRVVTLK
jgi:hypothetical protein